MFVIPVVIIMTLLSTTFKFIVTSLASGLRPRPRRFTAINSDVVDNNYNLIGRIIGTDLTSYLGIII